MNLPQDVANEALIATGVDFVIGDLQEGTRPAQILLQKYSQCLRQLLRAAHWNFSRKTAPLLLLADATGQTPNTPTNVIAPWTYSYALPIDCMKARWVPDGPYGSASSLPNGNIAPQNYASPIVANLANPGFGVALRPTRFLEAVDPNITPPEGSLFWETQGQSPQGNAVILSNVKGAYLVYTGLMSYPSLWDSQFRAAFVAFLASEVAFALWSARGQPAFGLKVRDEQVRMAAMKIKEARTTDGNEGWHNSDFETDWMKFRRTGGGAWDNGGFGGGGAGGPGYFFAGCDGCCGVGNTSAY